MHIDQYQADCLRTRSIDAIKVASIGIEADLEKIAILNWCLGLSGEIGELNDHIKKWLYHGHDLDPDYVLKELGDISYYTAVMAHEFGYTMSQVLHTNKVKLEDRYPDGFTQEASRNRTT